MTIPDRLSASLATRYRLERELGAGGMATVYLAADLKHDRRVAIKVLKPELAAVLGAERFVQEIKTTAALSHPHILPLFDSGEADGFLYYVMPYIEGETIREKLNREGQFGLQEAVKITTEVADALDYAHRHGVIHRDIKPENILLHDGRPMVMDFGIALAVSAAAGGRMTETGLSLGTPHYMSPEQATADKQITARSDVYSLASVCYEMLTGEPPHMGTSAQQIIMKIIAEPVQPATALRKSVPPNVSAALTKALEKLPADRFESAKAFADALVNPGFATGASGAPSSATAAGQKGLRRAVVALSVVAAAALILASWLAIRPSRAPDRALTVTTLLPPEGEDFSERNAFGALSPDGRRFAFVTLSAEGQRNLWIRSLDSLEAKPIAGTTGANAPFWSPDGASLAYFLDDGRLMRLDAGAGIPRVLCRDVNGESGSWGETGVIVIATTRGIERVPAEGGTCEVVIPRDSTARRLRHPSWLPGGSRVLFEFEPWASPLARRIHVGDLETGRTWQLRELGVGPTYVAPGLLVFGQIGPDGTSGIYAQRLGADGQTVDGEAVALTGTVRTSEGQFAYSVSPSGNLVYLPGLGDREKVLVSRSGAILDTVRKLGTWTHRLGSRRLSVAMGDAAGRLWLYDLDGGVSTLLATGKFWSAGIFPVWAPNDSAIASGTCRLQVVSMGDRAVRTLPVPETACYTVTDWSADGRHLILRNASGIASFDLVTDSLTPIENLARSEEGALAPNQRWIAYSSTETGTKEVFVSPWNRPGRPVRVSRTGGRAPRWRGDGRELFFQTPDGTIMSVAFPADAGAEVNTDALHPTPLFRAAGWTRPLFFDVGTPYDVSADGQRFVLRLSAATAHAVLVQNW
ncbi:MAG: protein kinase, partial [Gemmatimonadales bacterium]|nr:protein kinase [Gemmatimonadales bacterium]